MDGAKFSDRRVRRAAPRPLPISTLSLSHTWELVFTDVVSTDSGPVRNSSASRASSSSTDGPPGADAAM